MDTDSHAEGISNSNISSIQTESLLLTDRYLLTMAYSWFKAGMHSQIAVYEWFYRKNPFNAPYAVFCGVSESVDYLRNKAKFFPDELAYIAQDLQLQESDPFIQYLQNLDFKNLEISFIPEGTIVFPYLPLISIKGPLLAVQLLETLLLNKLNYPTLIATNARLMKEEIGPSCSLLEFGLRRAQGPDGGTIGALYAYIGGASSTSNVLAGKRYGIPIIGTMAHSFVTSFSSLDDLKIQQKHRASPSPSEQSKYIEECLKVQEELGIAKKTNQGELAAFISFSWDFPNSFICLIDTYDTLMSGILNYATVAIVMERRGLTPRGIRLDSGDLAQLSLDVKKILKEIGLRTNTKIGENSKVAASDDLSLAKIKAMRGKNSIDMFAVGTRLITCAEQSALGMVCKLSWLDGTPRIKYSEVAEKSTLPDRKQVHRVVAKVGESEDPEEFEVLSLYEEELNGEQIVFAHQDYAPEVKISIISSTKLLLDAGTDQGSLKLDAHKAKDRVNTEAKKYAHLVQHGLKRKLYISQNLKNLLMKLRLTHNQGE